MTPDGWRRVTLGDVASLSSGSTPSRKRSEFFVASSNGGVPWVKTMDLTDTWVLRTDEHVTEAGISEANLKVSPPGTVLVAMYGGFQQIGRTGILRISAVTNQAICALRLDPMIVDSAYCNYFLVGMRERWRALAASSRKDPNITKEDVRRFELLLPPLVEQQRIAAILSAVDDAIEATQAVIDQLQVVKNAMMSELLTRGLPGRHTRFKQTEIGEVPERWEIALLDSVTRRGSGHTPSKSYPEYWNGNIKWVSLQDSKRLDRLYIDDTAAKITPLGIANSSATEHPAGTVVLSRDAGVGKSAITTDVMAVSQHFMAWVCGPRLNSHYLYYWLQHMKPEFERVAIGNTIKTIGLPYFKTLRLALPPPDEQETIAKALTTNDLRIFAEGGARDQFVALKAALMSVLLTGEIRVTADEDAA